MTLTTLRPSELIVSLVRFVGLGLISGGCVIANSGDWLGDCLAVYLW